MFVRKDFEREPNTVAFIPDTLTTEKAPAWQYAQYQVYRIDALYISKANNTYGALVLGYCTLRVGEEKTNFDYRDFLLESRNTQANGMFRQINFYADIILNESSLWGAGGTGHIQKLKTILEVFEGLPELPDIYDGWYGLNRY